VTKKETDFITDWWVQSEHVL